MCFVDEWVRVLTAKLSISGLMPLAPALKGGVSTNSMAREFTGLTTKKSHKLQKCDKQSNQTLRQTLQKDVFRQVKANKHHFAQTRLTFSPSWPEITAH